MPRDLDQRNEGSLILFALLILLGGSLLLFLARTRAGVPPDAVNVNTASASALAKILKLDAESALRLVSERNRRGGFRYAGEVSTLNLFPPSELKGRTARLAETVEREKDRLIARGPRDVILRFAVTAALLMAAIVLIPVLLRRRGFRADPLLLPIILVLCVLGVFAQFTLRDPFRDAVVYGHHVGGLFLGLIVLFLGAALPASREPGRIPHRANLRRYTYVYALGAVLLILLLLLFGSGPGGVKLSLWFFQPIEAVKLLLIMFLAGYLADRAGLLADPLHRWRSPLKGLPAIPAPRQEDFAPMAGMFGAALMLFAAVKDLGPALVTFGTFLALFYIATGRIGILGFGLLLIAAGAMAAYRLHLGVIPVRIDMWLSPWNNAHPNGMQLGQSYWALSSGGLWGTGLGLGMPALLPRGRDDLVFSVLGEELGLIGSMTLLVLYCLLVARGFRAAARAQSEFDRMLGAGITALFACQIFLVLAGVTGLLPLTGITLPFLGYGNSALVFNLFAAGLLVGISHQPRKPETASANPLHPRGTRKTAFAAGIGILGVVGLGRIAPLQLLNDGDTAARQVRTPDSDGIRRAKINPRLLAIERRIPRGTIYDRKGRILAKTPGSRTTERIYPYGEATAHLVGYLDPELGGPVGLEREYHSVLRGFGNYSELVRDYHDKDIPQWLRFRSERIGKDLHLTIDAELQKQTFAILRSRAAALRDRRTGRRKNRASMVVLDPSTGEVLVAASLPSFDPNKLTLQKWQEMVEDRQKEARLFDRARSGAYPPGSSLKVATAAAAMEAGIDPVFTCNHVADRLRWRYGGRTYVRDRLSDDAGDSPHGRVSMPEGVIHSCNIYFARLGLQLGTERLRKAYAEQFGLRYVRAGREFARDLPLNAIGQGTMLASPMEMARIAAAVANRGVMLEPRFLKEIRGAGGRVTYAGAPAVMGRPIGELNARRLAAMMRSVVTIGTARGVFDALAVEVAGKTGTAQTDEGDRLPHSWFIGFTPFSQPRFAFACIIENGGYGKRGAAPAVNDVLQAIFRR